MPTNRPVRASATIRDILTFHTDIDMLAQEMREWANSMEGTNLEYTQKYEEVNETADVLEEAARALEKACASLRGVMEESLLEKDRLPLLDVSISYRERKMYKGYSMPRWVRLHNVVVSLRATVEFLDAYPEPKEGLEELEGALSDLETVDFPGMF